MRVMNKATWRLVQVKKKYNADNLFHVDQNIKP